MKKLLFLLACWSLPLSISAQNSYEEAIALGDRAFRNLDFKRAIDLYFAAEAFDPLKKSAVKAKIDSVFVRIENLRLEAENAEDRADAERDKAQKALANLRTNNRSIFDSFATLGIDLIESLDHEEALEKMTVAVDIDIDRGDKKRRLTEPVAELLFFFAESDRRPELARKAADLLLKLEPAPDLQKTLKQCLREGWNERRQFAPLLRKLPFFDDFQKRYYPTMIPVPLAPDSAFAMGSPETDTLRQDDETLHKVKLSPYYIAETPTTFYQFALFSKAIDRSLDSRTPSWGRFGDHPVVNVSWYETVEYANWLNAQNERAPCYTIDTTINSDSDNNRVSLDFLKLKVDWDSLGKGYRLPTEAEWELAAKGGGTDTTRTLYAGSNNLDEVGWYWKNSGNKPLSGDWASSINEILNNNGRTHPVGKKAANPIGLYDMSGNVYEWCWDWYYDYYYDECLGRGTILNPKGPQGSSEGRVLRGGSWYETARYCRSADRYYFFPDTRDYDIGFRLVFVP